MSIQNNDCKLDQVNIGFSKDTGSVFHEFTNDYIERNLKSDSIDDATKC